MLQTQTFMEEALKEAEQAFARDEVPVGCVIVYRNEIIARAGNQTCAHHDPTAHSEIIALRQAAKYLGSQRLIDCDLYVTLEPCTMCAGAISLARIRRLYFGAEDPKMGGVHHGARFFNQATCHHKPEIYSGLAETQCQALLLAFFQQKRLKEQD